jgi:acyl carrier protein
VSARVDVEARPIPPLGVREPGVVRRHVLSILDLPPEEVLYLCRRALVLRLERVGVEESYFELGGHSLLFMRLIVHVEDAFGLDLSIRAVFAAPTLEAMAAGIEQRVLEDILEMSDAEAEELAAVNHATEG